jgi:lysyl-tRNA synthetase class 2
MDEIDALLGEVFEGFYDYQAARRLDYRRWFLDETGLDPWKDDVAAFAAFARDSLASVPDSMPSDELDPWLDLLITHWLEPRLGDAAVFVMDYPPAQAALARVRQQALPVAERFELYVRRMELANGFRELGDTAEQRQRFAMDNQARRAAGQAEMPMDLRLLAALEHGLPDCSGVAIGFDRLVMIAAGLSNIDAAVPFGMQRA